jgi:hypothetical protein
MSPAEIVDRAMAVVGGERPDDYVIAPAKHAEELKDGAPSLSRVLHTSRVEAPMLQYQRLDAEAVDAQRTYKRVVMRANAAVLATAILSAVLMAVGLLAAQAGGSDKAGSLATHPVSGLQVVLIILGLSALLTGALASMWLTRVRTGRLLETWMRTRAMAEQARLAYFEAIVDAPADASSELPLPLLKLEYFRRYQLDVQIAFYARRRVDHRRSAERTVTLASLAAVPASLATAAGGLLGAMGDIRWLPLAALGSVGAALAFFASSREAVTGDSATAERYGAALSKLELLRGRLDEVRSAAIAGEPATIVKDFVKLVHDELSREQETWLKEGETARAGLTEQLDAALKKTGSEQPTPAKQIVAMQAGPTQ